MPKQAPHPRCAPPTTVLLTGASRGLGRALALRLATEAERMALCCHTRSDALRTVLEEVRAIGADAVGLSGDLAEADAVRQIAQRAGAYLGPIDALVLNAGITHQAPLVRTAESDWDRLVEVNLTGTVRLLRACLPSLRRGRGQVVLISSFAGAHGRAGLAAYAASKGALLGLTRSLARELGPDGIRVNAILPGFMDTDMGRAATEQAWTIAQRDNLLGAPSDPAGVADAIATFCRLAYVTGQVLSLDSRVGNRP